MYRWVWVVAACGRVGFDGAPDARPDVAPDASISLAEALPCATQVLMDQGGHDPHDVVRWIHDDSGDWLVGAHHYGQDDHKIERHPISLGSSGFVSDVAQFMVQGDHIDVLSIVPVAGGQVLGWNDYVLNTAQTNMLASGLNVTSANPLGMLRIGNPPLVRIGNGKLAMIGIDTNSALVAIPLGEDGAPPTGSSPVQIAAPSDGPTLANAIALDDGLAITWTSSATGMCKLATLSKSLSLIAGPVAYGTSCDDPQVAWLSGAQRLVTVAADTTAVGLQAAAWDLSLNPVTAAAPIASSGHWPRIVGDPDGVWLTWAGLPSPQPVMYARLDANATVTKMGAPVGTIDETLGHFHTIDHAGYATVIVWVDTINARTFAVEQLCE